MNLDLAAVRFANLTEYKIKRLTAGHERDHPVVLGSSIAKRDRIPPFMHQTSVPATVTG